MVSAENRRAVVWRVGWAAALGGGGVGCTGAATILMARKLFDGHSAAVVSGLGLLTLLTLLLASAGTAVILFRRYEFRPVIIPVAAIAMAGYLTFGLGLIEGDELDPHLGVLPGVALTGGAVLLVISASDSARRRVRPVTTISTLVIVGASIAVVIPWTGSTPLVETTTADSADATARPDVVAFSGERLSYTGDTVIAETSVDSGYGDKRTIRTDLVSRSLRDGSIRWHGVVHASASIYALPDTVIVTTSSPDITTALDARTGNVIWAMPRSKAFAGLRRVALPADDSPDDVGASTPALLFTDDTQTTLAAGDDRSGRLRWQRQLGSCALTDDPRVTSDTVTLDTACPASSGIAAVQGSNSLDATTGTPTSAPPGRDFGAPVMLGGDEMRSTSDGPVTIMIGTSDVVRRTLGRGDVTVSPDGRFALFTDFTSGRTVLLRADGQPDVAVADRGARGVGLNEDTVWVRNRYAVTIISMRLTIVDSTTGSVRQPAQEVSRLRKVTPESIVTDDGSSVASSKRLIFTGLTP